MWSIRLLQGIIGWCGQNFKWYNYMSSCLGVLWCKLKMEGHFTPMILCCRHAQDRSLCCDGKRRPDRQGVGMPLTIAIARKRYKGHNPLPSCCARGDLLPPLVSRAEAIFSRREESSWATGTNTEIEMNWPERIVYWFLFSFFFCLEKICEKTLEQEHRMVIIL